MRAPVLPGSLVVLVTALVTALVGRPALARPPARLAPADAEQAVPSAPSTYQVRLADLERKVKQLKEHVWRQPRRLPSYHPLHPDGPTSQGQRRAARLR